ncbi:unnamed protein product [Paramecium sonneborni]|uniref:50S ribosomal protein L35 n=1 Tax=Paramecium sonneborni TaxID=65129 RepID=A0A8S1R167_9CILI|nr:unnamed protein product [Paramecium sonneborni]
MLRLATQTIKNMVQIIPIIRPIQICQKPMQFFGLAKLFKQSRIIGQGRSKTKSSSSSWKKRIRSQNRQYKIGNHKGLLKRVKIVGPRRARRLKFKSAGSRHLNRNCSKANLRRKRRTRYISDVDMPRMRKLLPLMKRQKCKRGS